jgi:hypothetical protein
MAFGLIGLLIGRPKIRTVATTDRRIAIGEGSMWSLATVKGLVGEYPRATNLGQPSGLWWRCDALAEPLYIHKRFHKDVVAANSALGA